LSIIIKDYLNKLTNLEGLQRLKKHEDFYN
jgi:hypothetical protein